jgi:hypothetical protein
MPRSPIKARLIINGPLLCPFDAKIRRPSIDPDDLIYAHAGSMDACARAFLAADMRACSRRRFLRPGSIVGRLCAENPGAGFRSS